MDPGNEMRCIDAAVFSKLQLPAGQIVDNLSYKGSFSAIYFLEIELVPLEVYIKEIS